MKNSWTVWRALMEGRRANFYNLGRVVEKVKKLGLKFP